MDLHSMVARGIGAVNPLIQAVYLKSAGAAPTNEDGSQLPIYWAPEPLTVDVQAASGQDLQHVDNLNMQGVYRKIYLRGNAQGIVRTDMKGGDLFYFPQVKGGALCRWLVASVPETWSDWSCVIVCLQL